MSADVDSAPRRAVVIATTRTGSSWLASLLDSHPQIRFLGEIFNLEHAPTAAVRDPAAYLDDRLGSGARHRIVGFKLLYHQARLAYLNDFLDELDQGRPSVVDWRRLFTKRPVTDRDAPAIEATWRLVRSTGVGIIHLRRRNLLRRYVSHAILMADSQARWRGAPPSRRPRVRLAADRLASAFEAEETAREEIDRFFAGSPKADVFYEDLLDDFAGESARLLEFLGVEPRALESAREREVQRPLAQSIDNYGEVARALAGTAWQRFLDESGTIGGL